MSGSLLLALSEWPEARGWIARRPRIESNMTGKTKTKVSVMILKIVCYTHRVLSNSNLIREASPRTDGNRCRDPRPLGKAQGILLKRGSGEGF